MTNNFKFLSDLHKAIVTTKYCHQDEDFNSTIKRVATEVNKYEPTPELREMMRNKTIEYIHNRDFSPAGGSYRAAGNPIENVSFVNCTTQEPVKDSIEDIWESIKRWSKIASFGQGNGVDISGLRPKGTPTRNCARTSTGSVSFLGGYDSAMQVIGAENRRGATKVDTRVAHPDAEEFIDVKADITKLSTQNLSLKVEDKFMLAVREKSSYTQSWKRIQGKVYVGGEYINSSSGRDIIVEKKIEALDLFNKLALQAWKTGEPGVEYWDTSKKYSNSNAHPDSKYHIVSTNGCSEQKLDSYNTCILASINFYNMPCYNKNWQIWLEERVRFGIRFLDNVVEAEVQEGRSPLPEQREKLRAMTRIGLGFTGLADWLVKNDIEYGTRLDIIEQIMKVFTETSYRTSIALGKERGSFTEFHPDWYTKSAFVQQLCSLTNLKLEDITHMRHVCCTSIAPTGTLSFIVGTGGTGVENLFAPYFSRKERSVTGEYVSHLMFDNCVVREFERRGIELTKENVDIETQKSPWVFAANVDSAAKVKLMGVISKYIDSGISVTYNLPKEATVESVKQIFMSAWEEGLKSVTVYRDGSREGILNYTSNVGIKAVKKQDAMKRPYELPCDIHNISVKGEKYIVLVGMLDSPYEVFCGRNIPIRGKQGIITKKDKKHYVLTSKEESIDIPNTFNNDASELALIRMISTCLRHGVDIKFVVEQLEKSEEDMFSFSRAMSRVLKKYIPDGVEVRGEICPLCSSGNIVRQSGCATCVDCGHSKCV
jgi:ribonucleoside-diphosphate reductase alpha chain